MPTENFERLDTSRIARILTVALDEFARHRYQDASFNRIIRSCGMAKGTMYYYFASKEDLFMTLYKATVREFTPLVRVAQRLPSEPSQFWLTVTQLLEGLLYLLKHKAQAGLFVSNFLLPGSASETHPAAASIQSIERWLVELLSRGQSLGLVRSDFSPAQLARTVTAVWDSLRPCIAGLGAAEAEALDAAKVITLFRSLLAPLPGARTTHSEGAGSDLRSAAPGL